MFFFYDVHQYGVINFKRSKQIIDLLRLNTIKNTLTLIYKTNEIVPFQIWRIKSNFNELYELVLIKEVSQKLGVVSVIPLSIEYSFYDDKGDVYLPSNNVLVYDSYLHNWGRFICSISQLDVCFGLLSSEYIKEIDFSNNSFETDNDKIDKFRFEQSLIYEKYKLTNKQILNIKFKKRISCLNIENFKKLLSPQHFFLETAGNTSHRHVHKNLVEETKNKLPSLSEDLKVSNDKKKVFIFYDKLVYTDEVYGIQDIYLNFTKKNDSLVISISPPQDKTTMSIKIYPACSSQIITNTINNIEISNYKDKLMHLILNTNINIFIYSPKKVSLKKMLLEIIRDKYSLDRNIFDKFKTVFDDNFDISAIEKIIPSLTKFEDIKNIAEKNIYNALAFLILIHLAK